ncbi:aminomethyl-transferring glycine dehydrogenase subunit GcvPA [Thermaerobacter subterraneus]|uniref:Probable glycine dehydrogenase (decarboxylating) subunit 1 n=1 Tax=Thermaerobacter subterraneus DSM 13965 TaxID=867903 RepID=K6PLR3_9FIRM|nr:aminomethyl-transferring glycine dehydrogenase subunit GcvPA [Thermaerobacter subterraneus]EKP93812.1 glycine cleavage system protein P [Thermaerobacter subterraneus DSM 13965]
MAISYIPHTGEDRQAMLAALGIRSVEELFADIPPDLRLQRPLALPPALSEPELVAHLEGLAAANTGAAKVCFLGGGVYDHFIPSVVPYLAGRGEFATAYTPYQPEVSQGTLRAIFEFQTMVAELAGLDVANASMYDGATALAEAAFMAVNIARRERIVVLGGVHPEARQVVETYAGGQDLPVTVVPVDPGLGTTDLKALDEVLAAGDSACVLLQQPNFYGCLEPAPEIARRAKAAGALVVVSADPVSLGLLEAPGRYGADIVVGDGQSLGLPMAYGGPHFGYLACRGEYVRRLPGRIVGRTLDRDGREGYVLTLQTREQHIRRDRATSNICTNHSLMALTATIHLAALGPRGLRRLAEICLHKAHYLAERIEGLPGFRRVFQAPFFKEFAVACERPDFDPAAAALAAGYLVGPDLGRWEPERRGQLLVAVTERRTRQEMDGLLAAWGVRE